MLGSDMTLGAISYLYTTTRAQKMYFLSCADFWMALSYSRYIEFCRQLKAGSEGIGTYFTCMEGWGVFAMAPVVSCGGEPKFYLSRPAQRGPLPPEGLLAGPSGGGTPLGGSTLQKGKGDRA